MNVQWANTGRQARLRLNATLGFRIGKGQWCKSGDQSHEMLSVPPSNQCRLQRLRLSVLPCGCHRKMKRFLLLLFLAFLHYNIISFLLFPFVTHGYNDTHSHTPVSSWKRAAVDIAYLQLQWPLFRPVTATIRGTPFEHLTHGRYAIQFIRLLGVSNSLAWIMAAYLLIAATKRSKKPNHLLGRKER